MKPWIEFLHYLDEKFGKDTIDQWLRPLRIIRFDARNLYLDARDPFQISWFKEHVMPKHMAKLQTNSGAALTIHFSLNGDPFDPKKKNPKEQKPIVSFSPDYLEPQATLPLFLHGDTRHLPFEILCELVQYDPKIKLFSSSPVQLGTENPIYLYAPSGFGKSHLLMGTAHALKKRGLRVFYIHADTFSEQVVRAFRSSSLQDFRSTYRQIEVLLIDDVHLFAQKKATQEEFFHTFNWLHTLGNQIIISANCPPNQLKGIEERLISRFEWGLTLAFPSLSTETKKDILIKRAKRLSLPLDKQFISFLLHTFSSLPSLMRAVEALALRTKDREKVIDFEIACFFIKDLIEKENKIRLSPEKIIKSTAKQFRIKAEDILSRSQSKEYSLPRQIAMYLCRNKLKLPYTKIGELFFRDHSTVMTSVKHITKKIEERNRTTLTAIHQIETSLLEK